MNTTHELSAVVAHQRRKAGRLYALVIVLAIAAALLYDPAAGLMVLAAGALGTMAMHLWDGEQADEWWRADDE